MKNNLLSFLRSLFNKSPQPEPGALLDDRQHEERLNDIYFDDIVATANPVTWYTLDLERLPNWPVLNQLYTSACVAFTKALMSTMIYFARTGVLMVFSPKWIYNWRKNKGGGMIAADAFDIESEYGLIPEEMMPSQNLNETQINTFKAEPWQKEVGKALRMSDQRIFLPVKDIEILASVSLTTNKPIMVWFQFSADEWKTVPIVKAFGTIRHSTTMPSKRLPTDMTFGLYQGKKAIVIQDSWGLDATDLKGRRIITEDFFNARNIFAAYSMRFKFDDSVGAKPMYDGTIISLQRCLRYEGVFPTNVNFIENYGPVTRRSVAQFQSNRGLPVTGELDSRTVGTIKSIYS